MTAITSAQSIPAVPAALPAKYVLSTGEKRFVGLHLLFGLLALAIGSLFGPMQALEFAKVDLYQLLQPLLKSYYQGLTLHGVLNLSLIHI